MSTDWKDKVKVEEKNMRFCFNCGKLVKIKFSNRKRLRSTLNCSNCGESLVTLDDRR